MTQLEKLMARLASLEDGVSSVTFYKKNGELVFWIVEFTHKVEGEKKVDTQIPNVV